MTSLNMIPPVSTVIMEFNTIRGGNSSSLHIRMNTDNIHIDMRLKIKIRNP